MTWAEISAAARAEGFVPAPLRLSGEEAAAWSPVIVLLGAEARTWDAFQTAPEARDGARHPLDRWSARVASALAARFGGRAIGPSDGPPWPPFVSWAIRAEGAWPSRLGPLLHLDRGLWASWRGALALPDLRDVPPPLVPGPRPCDACSAPCLAACPVNALSAEGYEVPACVAHLSRPEGAPCRTRGCLARRACPVGATAAHAPDRAAFHMAAFRAAHAPADP